jgi:hypothetical protein
VITGPAGREVGGAGRGQGRPGQRSAVQHSAWRGGSEERERRGGDRTCLVRPRNCISPSRGRVCH